MSWSVVLLYGIFFGVGRCVACIFCLSFPRLYFTEGHITFPIRYPLRTLLTGARGPVKEQGPRGYHRLRFKSKLEDARYHPLMKNN